MISNQTKKRQTHKTNIQLVLTKTQPHKKIMPHMQVESHILILVARKTTQILIKDLSRIKLNTIQKVTEILSRKMKI